MVLNLIFILGLVQDFTELDSRLDNFDTCVL